MAELLIPNWLPRNLEPLLRVAPRCTFARSLDEVAAFLPQPPNGVQEVGYELPGRGWVHEATVERVRNGVSVRYPDAAMRRRDPDCLVVADDRPSDKPRFHERFGYPFEDLRRETFAWLAGQPLLCFAFLAGGWTGGVPSLVLCPENCGFFAYSLALLQGIVDAETLTDFQAKSICYLAPPFRHTHFQGRQIVVHNRLEGLHELFSYNLYPGPSAKKGVYGVLINAGEDEGWVTAHCSTVQVVTPYDNVVTFMHEGASGGGKSEMLENVHRQPDGRLLVGRQVDSGDTRHITLPRACDLRPVTDDMALCHPSLRRKDGKLHVMDAEAAWFVRVNHIRHYGTDPSLEGLTIAPPEPIVFINIDTVPGSTALIWEHQEDAPGKPCPNPRVILPRRIVPDVVEGAVAVDIRSFGVRTPPCTRENPSYGILGIFHVLPPALAWLWRLVAPRGHDNPSITDTEGMSSEGVGSYWPFATGRRIDQANLLLRQFRDTVGISYILIPNQHVGAWKCGFMPQWITREYLARRGSARFREDQVKPARCPLLGYALRSLMVEGNTIPKWFLEVEAQAEVGPEAYDIGGEQLAGFFRRELSHFVGAELDPLGRQIVDCCLSGGGLDDYVDLIPED